MQKSATKKMKKRAASVKASSTEGEGDNDDDDSLEREFEEERRKQANRDSAMDWISTWKANQSDPDFLAKQTIERQKRRDKILEEARSFEYVFVHDFIGRAKPEDAFAHMFLKDELGKLQISIFSPDLSGVESISEGVEVLAKAIEERRKEREGGKAKPLRLIGTSLGALCCVLYASKCDKEAFEGTSDDANVSVVDRLFLLGPCFDVEKCLFNYRATFNVTFSDEFIEDARKIDKFPFVTCPAYIVSGADDTIADLEDAVYWTRQASTLLRATNEGDDEGTKKMNTSSAKENRGREAGERRLLEVSGVGHRVESALPHALPRFKEFFNLPNV